MTRPPAVRSAAVDVVRDVGVLAIVAGHTFTWSGPVFFTWHVPVFFILTGYLWKPGRTTWFETRRRARTLLVPYVAWVIIGVVVWWAIRAHAGLPLAPPLKDILVGGLVASRPFMAFWFVTTLFFATVLMRWTSRLSGFLPWVVGLAGIVWTLHSPTAVASIPLSAGLALVAVLFICVGTALRRYRERITHPFLTGLVMWLPVWLMGCFRVFVNPNLKSGHLGTPWVSIAAACVICCGAILCTEGAMPVMPGWFGRGAIILAECALPVIFGHGFVLATLELHKVPDTVWSFLLAYSIPLAIGLIVRKIPGLRTVLM